MQRCNDLSDVMTRQAVCVAPSDDLCDTYALMERRGIRHLPVVEDGRLIGIVSDRDVFRYGDLSDGAELVGRQTVRQVMRRNVKTAKADESLADAVQVMITNKINALPVVDESGRVLGIVTSTDVMKRFINAARSEDLANVLEHRLQRFNFAPYLAES